VVQPLHVEGGQKLAVDVSLKAGAAKAAVAGTAAADIPRSTRAGVGGVVGPESIQGLALNGRVVVGLVLAGPGAHAGVGARARGGGGVRCGDRRYESFVLASGTAIGRRDWGRASECQFLPVGWRDQYGSDI